MFISIYINTYISGQVVTFEWRAGQFIESELPATDLGRAAYPGTS